jgi:RNase P/RNase MRP subunit POP5
VASAIRATGASTDGANPLIQTVARMGEPLYLCQPPTGYSEDSSRWMSNVALLERMNFAVALMNNRINGTRVDISRLATPGAVKDQNKFIDQLVAALLHSDVSPETRKTLSRALSETLARTTPARFDNRAAQMSNQTTTGIVALILGSREFQVK